MTATTARRATESMPNSESPLERYVMTASTSLYGGTLFMIDSNGLALAPASSANNRGCLVAEEDATSAASGTTYVKGKRGVYRFVGQGTFAQSHVGALCYAADNQTVQPTVGTNLPVAGRVREVVSATDVWVEVDPKYAL